MRLKWLIKENLSWKENNQWSSQMLIKTLCITLTMVFLRSHPTKHWYLLRGNEYSHPTVKLDKGNTWWVSQWDSERGWRSEKAKPRAWMIRKSWRSSHAFLNLFCLEITKDSLLSCDSQHCSGFSWKQNCISADFSASSLKPKIAIAQQTLSQVWPNFF